MEQTGQNRQDGLATEVLKELYRAYGELSRNRHTACGPGCRACCTDRVYLTTLEAGYLAEGLKRAGRQDILARAVARPDGNEAGPASTFNALARFCLAQKEPPQDPAPPKEPGVCPVLENGLCTAYEHRPMACRAMASLEPCRAGGSAIEDPWWVSLNAVFFQLAEHADAGGGYGPLPRVLNAATGGSLEGLLICEDMPGFLAPPEHYQGVEQTLRRLLDGPLGRLMARLKSGRTTAGRK